MQNDQNIRLGHFDKIQMGGGLSQLRDDVGVQTDVNHQMLVLGSL
jgi:hypothetical protein